jgi:hypothetical protein
MGMGVQGEGAEGKPFSKGFPSAPSPWPPEATKKGPLARPFG